MLPFLTDHLPGWSRKTIKQRLAQGCVTVNGASVKQFDYALHPGDAVEVSTTTNPTPPVRVTLEILYQDRWLVAINKPAGLLSVNNATGTAANALTILRRQLARPSRPVKLWPAHRIDCGTSGVLLFATSRSTREALAATWSECEKTYLAVVEGCPDPNHGTIDQPLRPDREKYLMHVGQHPHAKTAITHYQTERAGAARSLLRIRLATGRQHQIRAHLAWLGYPVVGDPRYGTAGPRLGLHAVSLRLTHPETQQAMRLEAPPPLDFMALLAPGA